MFPVVWSKEGPIPWGVLPLCRVQSNLSSKPHIETSKLHVISKLSKNRWWLCYTLLHLYLSESIGTSKSTKGNSGPVQTSRTFREPNLVWIKAETGWIDSDADLNCSWSRGRKMLISVKLLTKYVLIICALGTQKVRRLNQSRSKVAPKAKFPSGLGEKNGWAVPNWNRWS